MIFLIIKKQLRTSLLKTVTEKEKKHAEIVTQLERYQDSDPVVIEAKGIYEILFFSYISQQ